MNIQISGRHFDLTDALKEHVTDKLDTFSKYYDGITDIHVILEVTAGIEHAHIQLRGNHLKLDAKTKSHNMYSAFDDAAAILETRIRKFKDKLHGHPHRDDSFGNGNGTSYTRYLPIEESTLTEDIFIDDSKKLRKMKTSKAILEYEVNGGDYFVFLNSETDTISAVYTGTAGNSQVVELRKSTRDS